MSPQPFSQALPQWAKALRSELAGNARLRVGLLLIGGILWIYLLLLASDEVVRVRASTQSLREELSRILPLAKERAWPERESDAQQQLEALRAMLWAESDLGLVEARFQDWLRALAGKAGLNVRELTVVRGAAAEAKPAEPGQAIAIKARMLVDMSRLPLMALLSELGRHERIVVVDRLAIHLNSQPSLVELDLRIMAIAQTQQAATAGAGR